MIAPVLMGSAGPDRLNLQQGVRTALAAALAYWLTELLGLPGGYWAAISAIVVMQSEVGATVMASRDRFAGTTMGAVVGWLEQSHSSRNGVRSICMQPFLDRTAARRSISRLTPTV